MWPVTFHIYRNIHTHNKSRQVEQLWRKIVLMLKSRTSVACRHSSSNLSVLRCYFKHIYSLHRGFINTNGIQNKMSPSPRWDEKQLNYWQRKGDNTERSDDYDKIAAIWPSIRVWLETGIVLNKWATSPND